MLDIDGSGNVLPFPIRYWRAFPRQSYYTTLTSLLSTPKSTCLERYECHIHPRGVR